MVTPRQGGGWIPYTDAQLDDMEAGWDEELALLNRMPVMGPDGPIPGSSPLLWADPARESLATFLKRAKSAYHRAVRHAQARRRPARLAGRVKV